MKNRLFIGLLLFAVLTLNSQCKKKCYEPTNPDCENYDPCYGKKATSATFKILETTDNPNVEEVWQDYETDTIIGGRASFVANEDTAGTEYRWEIGAGIYKTRKVTLNFSSVPNNTRIPIKLTVTKKSVDKVCFPLDKGIDSITRTMQILKQCLVISPWETFTYRGSNTDKPNDIFDLKFYYDTIPFSGNSTIEGLIPNRSGIRADGAYGYRQFAFKMSNGINAIGSAFLKPNDSITINYSYKNAGELKIVKTFLGKKIK